jgi:hypothetical protein
VASWRIERRGLAMDTAVEGTYNQTMVYQSLKPGLTTKEIV